VAWIYIIHTHRICVAINCEINPDNWHKLHLMYDLRFSQRLLWRILSSGIYWHVIRWKTTDVALLATFFTLVSCLAYSPTFKVEATCSSETLADNRLHGFISMKRELFKLDLLAWDSKQSTDFGTCSAWFSFVSEYSDSSLWEIFCSKYRMLPREETWPVFLPNHTSTKPCCKLWKRRDKIAEESTILIKFNNSSLRF
jgi:hypothetical protein